MLVLAVASAWMKLSGEESADVSCAISPGGSRDEPPPVPVHIGPGNVAIPMLARSCVNALTPWGASASSAERIWPGPTGGSTPNGVVTFAGPVDHPCVV